MKKALESGAANQVVQQAQKKQARTYLVEKNEQGNQLFSDEKSLQRHR